MEQRLCAKIDGIQAEAKADSTSLRAEMKAMELRLIIKLGLMLVAAGSMISGSIVVALRMLLPS